MRTSSVTFGIFTITFFAISISFHAANLQHFSDIARVSAEKSIFIGLQGGLLLGDPVFYALAGALLEGYTEGAVAAVTAAGRTSFVLLVQVVYILFFDLQAERRKML